MTTAAVPAAELELGGSVRLADGSPAAGARVTLLPTLTPYEHGELLLSGRALPEAVAEAETDRDGWYRLATPEPGLWRLRVEHDGWLPAERSALPVVESRTEPAFELRPDDRTVVRVVNADGAPVPNAWVEAELEGGGPSPSRGPVCRGFTDAEGQVRLPCSARRALVLEAVQPGLAPVRRTGVDDVVLRLAPPASEPLGLRVETPAGGPAAGALVWGRTEMPIARTDENGFALVPLVPSAEDEPLRLRVLTADGASASLRLAADEEQCVVRLERPREIAVRVVDEASGSGLGGALVWADAYRSAPLSSHPSLGGATAHRTDADGWIRTLGSFPAESLLRAAHPGYRIGARRLDEETDQALAELPPIELVRVVPVPGVVRTAAGEPLAGATISALQVRRFGPRTVLAEPGAGAIARSTATGSFDLTLEPGQTYRVRAEHEDLAPAEEVLTLAAGAERGPRLELVLDRGASAWGTILSPRGDPVAGATVRLEASGNAGSFGTFGASERRLESTADESGVFRFAHLSPRTYDLSAYAPGFAVTAVPGVEVPLEAELEIGTLTLVEGAEIDGRVTDGNGAPLAGVTVSALLPALLAPHTADAYTTGGGFGGAPRAKFGAAVSAPDGTFVVADLPPEQPIELHFRHDGFLAQAFAGVVPPLEEPLEVVLEPGARVSGRVVDERREPVGGIRLVLQGGAPSSSAVSDEDGAFRFASLHPGRYTIHAQSGRHGSVTAPTLEVTAGGVIENVEVVLDPGESASVEGTVSDAHGTPVAGATLRATYASASSDADGRYRLEGVVPGERVIYAATRDGRRSTKRVELEVGLNRVDIELRAGVEVTGLVVDAYAEPVPGARVHLGSSFSRGASSTTDSAGSFRLENIEPGVYRLSAEAEGRGAAEIEEMQVADAPLGGLELRLEAGGSIAGRVIGIELDDLPRLRVVARATRDGRAHPAAVDYEGGYRIEGLRPGEWLVRATLDGSGLGAEESVGVEAGSVTPLDLELREGLVLSGTVLQEDEPVGRARIGVTGLDVARQVYGESDYRGRFRIGGLVPGRYRVEVGAGMRQLVDVREIELIGDEAITIELRPGGLAGIVVAPSGEPIAGAGVTVERMQETAVDRFQAASTDDGGRFRLAEVAPGSYRVTVRKEGHAETARTIEVPPAGDAPELRFVLEPTSRLELRLRTALGGTPGFPNLALLTPEGERVANLGLERTDSSGRLTLDTIPPGRWELVVTTGTWAQVHVPIEVPGEPVEVVLPLGTRLEVEVPELAGSDLLATVRLRDELGRRHLQYRGRDAIERVPMTRGRTEVSGLAAGAWTVEAVAPGGRSWSGSVTLGEGERRRIVLE